MCSVSKRWIASPFTFVSGPWKPATIDAVPADYKGTEVDWDLQPEGKSYGATLEPYPFRRDPLEISILARRIPKRHYADDLEFSEGAGPGAPISDGNTRCGPEAQGRAPRVAKI